METAPNEKPKFEKVGTAVTGHGDKALMIFLDIRDIKKGTALSIPISTLKTMIEHGGKTDISALPPRAKPQ
jgi:hypothetical protein